MDPQFKPVMDTAYAGDFALFQSLLRESSDLITSVSSDRGDSPNLIQFVVVEGGLGKIDESVNYLNYLIEHASTTDRQLVAAASVNAKELVDALISAGVPLDDGAPWTAVEEALYWQHRKMADYLVNVQGAQINTLCSAAMSGDLQRVDAFFDKGELIDAVLPVHLPWGRIENSTREDAMAQAFNLALRHGQYDVGEVLLERNADINAIARGHHEACTVLHHAAFENNFGLADWLIDHGARGDIKDMRFGDDAIGWAKHNGHTRMQAHLEARFQR